MNLIYLNNAATTWPKPISVIKAVDDSLILPFHEHGRTTIKNLIDYPKVTRQTLARFFHAKKPENFQFTQNATDSLNILIHGFIMHAKKAHVITTELEHNSTLRPLRTLEKGKKITLSIVTFNSKGYITLESLKKEIRNSTKLVVLNHGSNVLGTIQNIKRIGDYLHKKGIFFIVDAAQTAGHIKIDIESLNVDAIAFTGHKSLFGYPGIGAFYIKNPQKVDSFKQGGTGVFSQYEFQPEEMPLKYETGTLNYPGICSLNQGLKFITKTGLKKIQERTMKMTDYILKNLENEKNIIFYNKYPELPIISFNIKSLDNEDVGYILLKQYSIIVRTGLHCAPLIHKKLDKSKGCVRLSLSYFTTESDCKKAVKAIKQVANSS